MNIGFISYINISINSKKDEKKIFKEFETKFANLTNEIRKFQNSNVNKKEIAADALNEFNFIFKLTKKEFKLTKSFVKNFAPILFTFLLVNKINQVLGKKEVAAYNLSILEDWLLGKIIYNVFKRFYKNDYDAEKYYLALKVLLSNSSWCEEAKNDPAQSIRKLFSNESTQKLLHFNRYKEILYFNAESFGELLKMLFINNLLLQSDKKLTAKKINDGLTTIKKISNAAKSAGYKVSEVVEYL